MQYYFVSTVTRAWWLSSEKLNWAKWNCACRKCNFYHRKWLKFFSPSFVVCNVRSLYWFMWYWPGHSIQRTRLFHSKQISFSLMFIQHPGMFEREIWFRNINIMSFSFTIFLAVYSTIVDCGLLLGRWGSHQILAEGIINTMATVLMDEVDQYTTFAEQFRFALNKLLQWGNSLRWLNLEVSKISSQQPLYKMCRSEVPPTHFELLFQLGRLVLISCSVSSPLYREPNFGWFRTFGLEPVNSDSSFHSIASSNHDHHSFRRSQSQNLLCIGVHRSVH